jgi:hypothetical protein
VALAWHVAAFSRQKRLKPLRTYLRRSTAPKMGPIGKERLRELKPRVEAMKARLNAQTRGVTDGEQ